MRRLLSFICVMISLMSGSALSGEETLNIVFFGDESEDAALIYNSEVCILIDAGLSDTGDEIADHLSDNGISHIDTVILSHYDKDHIGGMKKLLKRVTADQVLGPSYEDDSSAYEKLLKTLGKYDTELTRLTEDTVFSIGPLHISIQVPDRIYRQENDMSIITYISYGDITMLFPGDIEKDRIQHELLSGVRKCDFIKLPHHGGIEDNTYEYLEACGARLAVITCSDEEPEDEMTVRCLEMLDIDHRLTRLGRVSLTCSADEIVFSE